MTWADLIRRVADKTGSNWAASRRFANTFFDELAMAARADPGGVMVPKFGTFFRRTRKARFVRNPMSGELMKIPGDERLGFRPSKYQKKKKGRA